MPKYYEVNQDDFESLPFNSELDEEMSGHKIVIEERSKDEFIAEQVANFTFHLLSVLHKKEARGDYNPFNKIAKKYQRRDECIVCPGCGEMIREEEDWNDNSDCLSPLCPFCLFEFEMETQT